MLLPSAALAQGPQCAPLQKVEEGLAKSAGEYPVAAGLSGEDEAIVVFTGEARTFTLVLVRPDGMACLIAAGTQWHDLPKPQTKQPPSAGDPS